MIPLLRPSGNLDLCKERWETIAVLTSKIVTIVDDDKSLRGSLVALLSDFGYDVSDFESAESFLASDQSNLTELLLADIEMPGMNGFELADKMSAAREELAIVLMTGGSAKRPKNSHAGDNEYCLLRKPFQSQLLLDCIEKALSDRPSTRG